MALIDKLTAIADAIRGKTGKTEEMTLDQMVTEIAGIQTGGGGDTTMEDGVIEGDITEYTNDRVTTVRGYGFYMSPFKRINLPNVTMLTNSSVFSGCSATQILLPRLERGTGGELFRNCKITSASFPSYGNFPMPVFMGSSSLQIIDIDGVSNLADLCLSSCKALDTLVLRKTSDIVVLSSVRALAVTPFAEGGTGGTVYVPQALISQYQTATNWSTLYAAGTCNFVAIEGSEYE